MSTPGWSRAAAAFALTMVLGGTGAWAAPPGFVQHRVTAGETLASIGERYLRTPTLWRDLQSINNIADPQKLVPGSIVKLPRRLVRPAGMAVAQVEFVQGATTGTMHAGKEAAAPAPAPTPLAAGDAVTEGTRLSVPEDGYLRLKLADGSVVRVLADSDVELKRLRGKRPGASYQSVIEVQKGKVESEVAPQPRGRTFEVQAPGAVASVRGTRFDVAVGHEGQMCAAVTEGTVLMKPRKARRNGKTAMVAAGQGAVFDGKGQLSSRQSLPGAPDLTPLPQEFQDPDALTLAMAPLTVTGSGYEVRIARDERLHEVVRNGVFQSEKVKFAALEDGDYTVGVRTINPDGLAGPESHRAIRVHANPVPPLYQSPAPGGRVISEAGQLVCSEVAGSGGVLFEVASDADFRNVRLHEVRAGDCRIGIAGLPAGDYWWRVASLPRGGGEAQRGPFAAGQAFTVAVAPSTGVVDIDDSGESPTLHWQAGSADKFRGQLARDEAFTQLVADVELASPAWTLSGQPRGQYFVRLQARDADGLAGPFSPARRVRIGAVVRSGFGDGLTTSDGAPIERP
ncbi:FecR domain-containing protein [Variovorax sp. dw_308]|uniref:FecR domain-containing protein n=1 Tax=Variovorax sp. dw_308 TaxID=2721546 RepID=UPI001C4564B2|nr:FecR domain-containing protein [Variovorax sp. dw_308]